MESLKKFFLTLFGKSCGKKEEEIVELKPDFPRWVCSKFSFQGKKDHQEDDVLVWQDERDVVVLVADGVGGHGHGDWASHCTIHDVFEKTLNALGVGESPAEFLKKTCFRAAQEVWNKSSMDPDYKNCGTTLTGFIYRKSVGYWTINVGDSRVYRINTRKKRIVQLTQDQVDESISRKMKYAIGQRPDYMRDHIDVIFWNEDEDLLQEGDVLMAVSDGVCEPFEVPMVGNEKIYTDNDAFRQFMTEMSFDENSATKIVENSYQNGSRDNITCALMVKGK